jgi:uncharacterized protein YbjQ (UPF0145 family)
MKRLAIAAAVTAVLAAACAVTEVAEYRAAPGHEFVVGTGGAVKVVDGMEVWLEGGTPPRKFRVIAEAYTKYEDEAYALSQIVEVAKKHGADAVIILSNRTETTGVVAIPGTTTTNLSGYGNYARATTTTTPGYVTPVRVGIGRTAFIKYVD